MNKKYILLFSLCYATFLGAAESQKNSDLARIFGRKEDQDPIKGPQRDDAIGEHNICFQSDGASDQITSLTVTDLRNFLEKKQNVFYAHGKSNGKAIGLLTGVGVTVACFALKQAWNSSRS